MDEPFSADQQDLFARDPDTLRRVRQAIFDQYESASFHADTKQTRDATDLANGYLERKVTDPALRAKLTPSYPVGCKRPLLSRDWFPTFALPHVHLETSPIVEFTVAGLHTADGVDDGHAVFAFVDDIRYPVHELATLTGMRSAV